MGKYEKKRPKTPYAYLAAAGIALAMLVLAAVLILSGRDKTPGTASSGGSSGSTQASQTEPQESSQGTEPDDPSAPAPEASTAPTETESGGETQASAATQPQQETTSGSTGAGISFPYTSSIDGVRIVAVYSYSGYYIEDGTEDAIDNVAVLEVTNLSGQAIEYATITLTADGETLHFQVALLPAGGTALVMEADKKSCGESAVFTYGGSEIAALATLDMCESQVRVSTDDSGAITVTNISGEDIQELRLFYKNQLDTGEYVGGIAYTVRLEGLAAGESRTVYPSHFDPVYGVVMMVRIY